MTYLSHYHLNMMKYAKSVKPNEPERLYATVAKLRVFKHISA